MAQVGSRTLMYVGIPVAQASSSEGPASKILSAVIRYAHACDTAPLCCPYCCYFSFLFGSLRQIRHSPICINAIENVIRWSRYLSTFEGLLLNYRLLVPLSVLRGIKEVHFPSNHKCFGTQRYFRKTTFYSLISSKKRRAVLSCSDKLSLLQNYIPHYWTNPSIRPTSRAYVCGQDAAMAL